MASYGGLYGILTGLTRSTDHPSRNMAGPRQVPSLAQEPEVPCRVASASAQYDGDRILEVGFYSKCYILHGIGYMVYGVVYGLDEDKDPTKPYGFWTPLVLGLGTRT